MIPAIEEALMTMAPGAKVTVVTPSSQGFADIAIDEKMPAYSPLVIELELMEIK
jgi:FKBP-type peptidyl-prolyl cis-trans isomerase